MTGSTKRYKSTTFERNLDSFEFGSDFTDSNIQEEIDRNGLAYFWTFGITKEAIGDGFDLLDEDGNILPIQQELDSLFESTRFYPELIQLIGYIRAYGKAGQLHMADGSFKAFKPVEMALSYDLVKRQFTEAILLEKSIYTDELGYIEHKSGETFNIEDFQYWFFNEKDKTLEGRSELEPIWDYLQGLFICAFLSPLIVAQVTGVKVMRSPLFAQTLSADQQADAVRPIRDMRHKLVIGMGPNDELEIMYPPSNTFIEQTVDMLFSYIASATGYPKEAWRGNQVGTTSGASQTETRILEIHKTIQKAATPFVKQSLRRLAEIVGIGLPERFTVDWRFKENVSEEQEANLKQKLAQAVSGLADVLTGNEIREILGLEPLDYFDDTLPLSQNQQGKNDIGINVTGLESGSASPFNPNPDPNLTTTTPPPEPNINQNQVIQK